MIGLRNLSKLTKQLNKMNSTIAVINNTHSTQSHTLPNQSVISHVKDTQTTCISYRYFTYSNVRHTGKSFTNATNNTPNIGEYDTLTEYHAYDMIHKLSDNERASLSKALKKYDSDKIKSKFQGKLASSNWRLKFGRRTGEQLGSVDPTGSFCAMPDDWIKKKLAEAAVKPSNEALFKTFMVSAVPFVGFGFLDNFFMIIAGDYIESLIGVYICISTMAAAALGNTISDIFGLGLAGYVEQFCTFIGIIAPDLTPTQQNMTVTQRAASLGRVIGITFGCLLGMFPLLLINKEAKAETN